MKDVCRNLKSFETHLILSKLEGFWVDDEDNLMHAVASRITFICPMSFNSFPMDVQVCVFQVGSFNYATNKLLFRDEFIPVKEEAIRLIYRSVIFMIIQKNVEVHPGLRYQHLPPPASGQELHRPQHELQRCRLPAGSLQEGFFLHRDVLSPLGALRHCQLDFISNQS